MELEHSLQVMVGVLDSFVDNANTVEDAWEAVCTAPLVQCQAAS